MMQSQDLQAIRALIGKAKRRDALFGVIGILSLMIGVMTFSVLFIDMDGTLAAWQQAAPRGVGSFLKGRFAACSGVARCPG